MWSREEMKDVKIGGHLEVMKVIEKMNEERERGQRDCEKKEGEVFLVRARKKRFHFADFFNDQTGNSSETTRAEREEETPLSWTQRSVGRFVNWNKSLSF